jgi:hypothetical protein
MAQTAFAERSEVLATGQDVHLYSLTTKDDQGGSHCYDVLVNLPIGSDGLPAASAPVTVARCPKVKPGDFVVGNYAEVEHGWACTLQASPHAGRTELDLTCDAGGYHWMYTWYTGPIKGSPIEDLLVNAGLDKLPDHDDYSWGRVVAQNWNYDGCTYVNSLFGAREVGGRITLSIYKDDALLDCTHGYTKAP